MDKIVKKELTIREMLKAVFPFLKDQYKFYGKDWKHTMFMVERELKNKLKEEKWIY